mgnify:CR=1 FL=1
MKLFSLWLSAAACLFLGVVHVTAMQPVNEERLSLPALIEEMAARSPEVKAARERWEAAKAVVPQVQTLPDPRLQLGYQRMPMTDPLQGAMYGFGQEIPFPGKLGLKGDIARREAERFEQRDVRGRGAAGHVPQEYFAQLAQQM